MRSFVNRRMGIYGIKRGSLARDIAESGKRQQRQAILADADREAKRRLKLFDQQFK